MHYKKKPILALIFIALLAPLCSGCSVPRIYKLDIEQGNKLSPEFVKKLQVGMTQQEVSDLLGTPVLNDIFHKNRWDYVYYKKPGYGKLQKQRLTVFFEDGTVSKIMENQW